MTTFWAVAILFVLYAVYERWRDSRSVVRGEVVYEPERILPYVKRRSVLNRSEYAFREELVKQLPQGYQLFSKMRIIDFVDSKSREYTDLKEIWARHIDFLICDKHAQPVVAIELNGDSHINLKRIDRDAKVAQILGGIGLPLEIVKVGTSFEYGVDTIIKKYIK